jgi:membrane-bound lytic murein transglycosylase D
MWQFIASTGRDYGLKQNWWYDGRRDVLEATEAALDYLEKLHSLFDDWQLALAAYNWGEGAVSRAMERNRAKGLPTDYESLALPSETRNYVPKLIAVKNIVADPARFDLEVQDIQNEPYFETVAIERHIDIELAAKLAELPPDQFRFLNPGHKKPVIRAGEAERIVLPKENAATFRTNLKTHAKPLVSWKTVRLRRGDRVHRVAARHGMTVGELKRANGLATQRRLRAGQPLLVRVSTGVLNPQLPEISSSPVSLPRAISVAKAKSKANAKAKGKGKAKASSRKGADRRRAAKVRVTRQRSARVKQVRASSRGHVRVVAPRATRSDGKRVSSRTRSPRS